MRLDAPTCMPAAGNVHWYRYTLQNTAASIGGNGAGPIGVYDEHGQPVQCIADASAGPVGLLGSPGDRFYIAVPVGGPITALTIGDVSYTGVGAIVTDMDITFPSSAVAEQGMAAITAAVVGVILNLAVWFALHTLFGRLTPTALGPWTVEVPVWSCISTSGIESFEPPEGVRELIVFADNDPNFAGQKAAFAVAHRLKLKGFGVEVIVPPEHGDWLDVLNRRKVNDPLSAIS